MIIGRTSSGAESRLDETSLLTKERYYYISKLVRNFIIKNKIKTLPISLNEIIKRNKWKVITYTSLYKLNLSELYELMQYNWGFTECVHNKNYIICYNDSISVGAQRFTIAHEIGHIVLKHFDAFNANMEQEANMFAARLLMPMCVLYECNITSPLDIQNLCRVSCLSASIRFKRFLLLKSRRKFYTESSEIKLKKYFYNFICKNKFG